MGIEVRPSQGAMNFLGSVPPHVSVRKISSRGVTRRNSTILTMRMIRRSTKDSEVVVGKDYRK